MGTEAPTTIVIPIHCAPKKAPCPKCGKHGHRKRKAVRKVRTVAYKAIAYLEITCGEYTARCDCCTTFRNTPEGVLPKALYDNKVRDLVLDRILKDEMNVGRHLANDENSNPWILSLGLGKPEPEDLFSLAAREETEFGAVAADGDIEELMGLSSPGSSHGRSDVHVEIQVEDLGQRALVRPNTG